MDFIKSWEERKAVREKVRGMYPEVPFPTVYSAPLHYGTRNLTKVQDRVAVVGVYQNEETVYDIVSDQYLIVDHEEVLNRTHSMLKECVEFGEPNIVITLPENGARMNCLITFSNIEHKVNGDKVMPRLAIRNSYNRKWEFMMKMEAWRKVCSNGLHAWKSILNKRGKHRLCLDVKDMISELKEGMDQFSEQIGLWTKWARKELNESEFAEIWDVLPFGERHREEIKALPEAATKSTLNGMLMSGDKTVNMWDFHSIVTQFLTHEVDSEVVRVDKTEKVGRVFSRFLN